MTFEPRMSGHKNKDMESVALKINLSGSIMKVVALIYSISETLSIYGVYSIFYNIFFSNFFKSFKFLCFLLTHRG